MASEMLLKDLFSLELLHRRVDEGYVRAASNGDLTIYCYSSSAVYTPVWDEVTMTCRGLIADSRGHVVARPFRKFFNPSEQHAPVIPSGVPMHVTEKLDGSLGIGYIDTNGSAQIATKGSFDSPQAAAANCILRDKYPDYDFPGHVTPLFEIIDPDHRIVLDYGDTRDLVLLAVTDIRTGADLDPGIIAWPGPVATQRPYASLQDLIDHVAQDDEPDKEGYVVRFDTGPTAPHVRLKLKFPEYVSTHRFLSGLTAGKVWEIAALTDVKRRGVELKRAASVLSLDSSKAETIMDMQPDPVAGHRELLEEEFLPWYDALVDQLNSDAAALFAQYESMLQEAEDTAVDDTGKAFADAVFATGERHDKDAHPLFKLRQGNPDGYVTLWNQLRPENTGEIAKRSASTASDDT